jgi:hypothetical protein
MSTYYHTRLQNGKAARENAASPGPIPSLRFERTCRASSPIGRFGVRGEGSPRGCRPTSSAGRVHVIGGPRSGRPARSTVGRTGGSVGREVQWRSGTGREGGAGPGHSSGPAAVTSDFDGIQPLLVRDVHHFWTSVQPEAVQMSKSRSFRPLGPEIERSECASGGVEVVAGLGPAGSPVAARDRPLHELRRAHERSQCAHQLGVG